MQTSAALYRVETIPPWDRRMSSQTALVRRRAAVHKKSYGQTKKQ